MGPHATALGKAVLSQLDPAEVQRRLTWPLEKLTPDTVVDPDAFLAELAEARLRGWAVDDGENAVDVRCVAVPLGVSPDGGDAVGCSAPRSRMGDERIEEVARAVTEAAHSLTMLLKRLGQH
ncbi:IclR family transcriptional regulator [Streptomyces sp. NPDC056161]|uniref:IclR family transcriptional regulator n=1 Tax=Streptomyces sp. NPDC056161 TaxID=3345732 RepID=UPI0035DFDD5C